MQQQLMPPPVDPLLWGVFAGPHLALTLFRGWRPIIANASRQVLERLEGSGVTFRWVLLEERDGAAQVLYELEGEQHYCLEARIVGSHRAFATRSLQPAPEIRDFVEGVAWEIERLTMAACIVCGQLGQREVHFGRLLPLCQVHQPEYVVKDGEEGLEGIWRLAVEWTSVSTGRAD